MVGLVRCVTLTVSVHAAIVAPAEMLERSKAIRVRWTLSDSFVTPTTSSALVP